MADKELFVWDKFDVDEYKRERDAAALANKSEESDDDKATPGRVAKARKRVFWFSLNIFAAAFWLYVPLKLFVGDFDRWVVETVSPSLLWVLDYRFFILLVVVTVAVLVLKRWRIAGMIVYVLIFPLIVLCWKIPRMYYRAQSWNLVIGSAQLVWSLAKSLRFALVLTTAFALSSLAIALDAHDGVLWIAVGTLCVLWGALLVRAIAYAIVPSKFVVYQQRLAAAAFGSDWAWRFAALPDVAKSKDVDRLTKTQVDQLVTQASWGLVMYGGGSLWAEKLDAYRKSGTTVIFSAFAVVALAGQAVVIFTLVNLGLYRIDSSQFEFDTEPRFATFVRYSLNSMFPGDIDALQPAGSAATWVSVGAGFSFAVILLVLVVSVVFSLKQGRDDRVAEKSIQEMRATSDAFASKLAGEYRLPLEDLLTRILDLGGLVGVWVRYVSEIAVAVQRANDDNPRS